MASAADTPYEAVKDELAVALRSLQPLGAPGELARQILAYDTPDHTHVVGVDYAGEKVVLYHSVDEYAVFVRLTDDGLADGGSKLGSFDRGSGFEAWVEKMGAYWGWRHPRYR